MKRIRKKISSFIFLFFIITLNFIFLTHLGRATTYSYYSYVKLSYNKPYSYTTNPSAPYTDNGKKLTDGNLSDTYTDGKGVGWQISADFELNVTLDLGDIYSISRATIHSNTNDNYKPTNITIYVSTDNITYTYVGNATYYASGWYISDFTPTNARYVKFKVFKLRSEADWVFLSEIEIYNATLNSLTIPSNIKCKLGVWFDLLRNSSVSESYTLMQHLYNDGPIRAIEYLGIDWDWVFSNTTLENLINYPVLLITYPYEHTWPISRVWVIDEYVKAGGVVIITGNDGRYANQILAPQVGGLTNGIGQSFNNCTFNATHPIAFWEYKWADDESQTGRQWKTCCYPGFGSYSAGGYPLYYQTPSNATVIGVYQHSSFPGNRTFAFEVEKENGTYIFYGRELLISSFIRVIVHAFNKAKIPLVGINYLPNIYRTILLIRHDEDYNSWDATRNMYAVEKSHGVVSTFYFTNSTTFIETYNNTIANWIKDGWYIGSHTAEHAFNYNTFDEEKKQLNMSYAYIEKYFNPAIYGIYGRDMANPFYANTEAGLMALENESVVASGGYGNYVSIPFHFYLNDTNLNYIGRQKNHLTGFRPFGYAINGSYAGCLQSLLGGSGRQKFINDIFYRQFHQALPLNLLWHDWLGDQPGYNATFDFLFNSSLIHTKNRTQTVNMLQVRFALWWLDRENIKLNATYKKESKQLIITVENNNSKNITGITLTVYDDNNIVSSTQDIIGWIYYDNFLNNDASNLTYIVLPMLPSKQSQTFEVNIGNHTLSRPYIKYILPNKISEIVYLINSSFDTLTNEFSFTINGSGVNTTIVVFYNPTDNFNIKDNGYIFALIRDGKIQSSDVNYHVSYNYSTGSLSFVIPTLSKHTITIVESLPDGSACSSADECSGGYCVHGICRSSSTYCGDGYCDEGENCRTCWKDCGLCPGPPVTLPSQPQARIYLMSISPSIPKKINISKKGIDVTELYIAVNNRIEHVRIKIEKIEKPANLPSLENVYSYLNFTFSNLHDENISLVKIKFKVNNTWIRENNITTIVLQRYYDNKWNKLNTTKLFSDAEYTYYQAISPGLSIFAITGEKMITKPIKKCPICPEPTEWSECINNKQTRTVYKCNETTNYTCKSYIETRRCEIEEIEEISKPKAVQWYRKTWEIFVSVIKKIANIFLFLLYKI